MMIVLWLTIINILSSLILLIINLIIFYYYCHHTEKKKVGKSFVYFIVNIGFSIIEQSFSFDTQDKVCRSIVLLVIPKNINIIIENSTVNV